MQIQEYGVMALVHYTNNSTNNKRLFSKVAWQLMGWIAVVYNENWQGHVNKYM